VTTLLRKMAKGAAWLVSFRLLDRGIGIVSTLILARILVPGDFGLVAMATALLAALELLGAFSFDLALVQNQHAERRHYDTAWTFAVCFGIFNAVVLFSLAMPMAAFYDEPRLEPVVYAIALCTFINGLDNIGIVSFQKELQLHKEFWFSLQRRLIGFAVTITLAFTLRSYWALIGGILATRLAGLGASYLMSSYRPRPTFAAARELFGFSKWLLLNNLLIFLNNRGMDFVIGKVGGARALGLYSLAYEIANLPTTELVWPIQRAVFPGYAKVAHNRAELRRAFIQVIGLVALITIPAGALIGLVAEPMVRVVLGPKWLDAVPLIQVFAVFGIVRSIHGPTGSIYLAIGKPRVVAFLQCLQLLVTAVMMIWLVPQEQVRGAALSILIGATAAMLTNYALVLRELDLRLARLLSVLWRPLTASAAMALIVSMIRSHVLEDATSIAIAWRLAVLCIAAGVTYVTVVLGCWMLARRPAGPEQQLSQLASERFRARPSAGEHNP
jgi:lipopolysaccharide exporter